MIRDRRVFDHKKTNRYCEQLSEYDCKSFCLNRGIFMGKHYNFKEGIIRESSGLGIGSGVPIGNVKRYVIYQGSSYNPGNGKRLGNVKDGVIREGQYSTPGNGHPIGNVKNGNVYSGNSSTAGNGHKIGKVDDFTIPGMEHERDDLIVAAWHFLVKKIF